MSLSGGDSRTSPSIVQRLRITRDRTQVENTVLLTGDSEALRNHSGQEPVLLHKRTLYHVRTGRHPPHTRGATAGGQKGPVRRRRSLASRFTKRDYVDACQCCRTIRYQGSDLQPRFRLYYVVRVYRSTVLKYFIFPTLPPQIRATYEGLRPPISLHPNTITLFNTADAMGTMGAFISCFSIEENY